MVEWFLLLVIGLIVLLGVYLIVAFLHTPLRLLTRLFVCLVTGAVFLVALNFVLGYFDMHVAVNPFTVLVAGILRLPGLVLLLIISAWFV